MKIQTIEKTLILTAALATIVSTTVVCTQVFAMAKDEPPPAVQIQPCVLER